MIEYIIFFFIGLGYIFIGIGTYIIISKMIIQYLNEKGLLKKKKIKK